MQYNMTKRQKDVFNFIKLQADVPPTIEEIREACGFASKSQVHNIMLGLRERGRIDWIPNRRRSIKILDGKMTPKEIEIKTIRECVNILENKTKCKIAAFELKKALTRIELEMEVSNVT